MKKIKKPKTLIRQLLVSLIIASLLTLIVAIGVYFLVSSDDFTENDQLIKTNTIIVGGENEQILRNTEDDNKSTAKSS